MCVCVCVCVCVCERECVRVCVHVLTAVNVAEHTVCAQTPPPQLSATAASLHPKTSPAETGRSHTPLPTTHTHTQSAVDAEITNVTTH